MIFIYRRFYVHLECSHVILVLEDVHCNPKLTKCLLYSLKPSLRMQDDVHKRKKLVNKVPHRGRKSRSIYCSPTLGSMITIDKHYVNNSVLQCSPLSHLATLPVELLAGTDIVSGGNGTARRIFYKMCSGVRVYWGQN